MTISLLELEPPLLHPAAASAARPATATRVVQGRRRITPPLSTCPPAPSAAGPALARSCKPLHCSAAMLGPVLRGTQTRTSGRRRRLPHHELGRDEDRLGPVVGLLD